MSAEAAQCDYAELHVGFAMKTLARAMHAHPLRHSHLMSIIMPRELRVLALTSAKNYGLNSFRFHAKQTHFPHGAYP